VNFPAFYVGTKILTAERMTRSQYNQYRSWATPANENPNDEGYLVEYRDGGAPNDPRHKGYISWSPKEVFEKSYRYMGVADDSCTDQFLQLYAERTQLLARIAELAEECKAEDLPKEERKLLICHIDALRISEISVFERLQLLSSKKA